MTAAKLLWKKHGSTILTYLGGAGIVATVVLAVKATPKALEKIEVAREEKGEELTKWETVKVASIVYIPTAVTGMATIACIAGANVLNNRQQASVASAYALLDQGFKEYKNKLIELYGQETHEEIIDAIAADKMYISGSTFATNCELTPDEFDDEEQLFYDEFSGRFFTSSLLRVMNAEYHLNRNYVLRGCSAINEFYDFLGLDHIDGGDDLGWEPYDEGMYWIDFNHRRTVINNQNCIVIDILLEPELATERNAYWY